MQGITEALGNAEILLKPALGQGKHHAGNCMSPGMAATVNEAAGVAPRGSMKNIDK